jgi:hypothetical protein
VYQCDGGVVLLVLVHTMQALLYYKYCAKAGGPREPLSFPDMGGFVAHHQDE